MPNTAALAIDNTSTQSDTITIARARGMGVIRPCSPTSIRLQYRSRSFLPDPAEGSGSRRFCIFPLSAEVLPTVFLTKKTSGRWFVHQDTSSSPCSAGFRGEDPHNCVVVKWIYNKNKSIIQVSTWESGHAHRIMCDRLPRPPLSSAHCFHPLLFSVFSRR